MATRRAPSIRRRVTRVEPPVQPLVVEPLVEPPVEPPAVPAVVAMCVVCFPLMNSFAVMQPCEHSLCSESCAFRLASLKPVEHFTCPHEGCQEIAVSLRFGRTNAPDQVRPVVVRKPVSFDADTDPHELKDAYRYWRKEHDQQQTTTEDSLEAGSFLSLLATRTR